MKFLFDIFPVVLFFVAFKVYDIYVATAVAIAATLLQVGWTWLRHRKVDKMLWVGLAVIVVFGGATLLLQDEMFIKWKPTVLYWLFAVVLAVAVLAFRKNLIRAMMEKQLTLPDAVWSRVNLSWAGFFLASRCSMRLCGTPSFAMAAAADCQARSSFFPSARYSSLTSSARRCC